MSKNSRRSCILLAAILSTGCLSANGNQAEARYPSQLHGVWQGDGDACRLPGNMDSDTRIEIASDKLVDYEQWNEPTAVLMISDKPQAWKIKSRLYIDDHSVDQDEIYALSSSDFGVLTVIDQSRSATYVRCK